jgi:hypothetical protein
MIEDMEQQIRTRAYELWALNGRLDGRAEEHWLEAERQVRALVAAPAPAAEPRDAPARALKRAAAKRPSRSSRASATMQ